MGLWVGVRARVQVGDLVGEAVGVQMGVQLIVQVADKVGKAEGVQVEDQVREAVGVQMGVQARVQVGVQMAGREVGKPSFEGDGCQVRLLVIVDDRVGPGRRMFPSTRESERPPKSKAMETRAMTIPRNTCRLSNI